LISDSIKVSKSVNGLSGVREPYTGLSGVENISLTCIVHPEWEPALLELSDPSIIIAEISILTFKGGIHSTNYSL